MITGPEQLQNDLSCQSKAKADRKIAGCLTIKTRATGTLWQSSPMSSHPDYQRLQATPFDYQFPLGIDQDNDLIDPSKCFLTKPAFASVAHFQDPTHLVGSPVAFMCYETLTQWSAQVKEVDKDTLMAHVDVVVPYLQRDRLFSCGSILHSSILTPKLNVPPRPKTIISRLRRFVHRLLLCFPKRSPLSFDYIDTPLLTSNASYLASDESLESFEAKFASNRTFSFLNHSLKNKQTSNLISRSLIAFHRHLPIVSNSFPLLSMSLIVFFTNCIQLFPTTSFHFFLLKKIDPVVSSTISLCKSLIVYYRHILFVHIVSKRFSFL